MPTHLRTFDPFADSDPFSDSPINHPITRLPDYPIQVRPCLS